MRPLLLLGALVVWLSTIVRPRWWPRFASGPLQRAGRAVLDTLAIVGSAVLGICLDPTARAAFLTWAGQSAEPLRPLGQWLIGPTLVGDLLAVLPLLVLLVVEGTAPGTTHPVAWRRLGSSALRRAGAGAGARAWLLAPFLPLVVGWFDVLCSTLGRPGAQVYRALAAVVPVPGVLVAEPDARLPAFVWWLAASVVAVRVARSYRRPGMEIRPSAGQTRGERHAGVPDWADRADWVVLWHVVPVLGGVLALVSGRLAQGLAVPAMVVVGGAAIYAGRRASPRRPRMAWPQVVARSAVPAVLALALALRWTGVLLSDPSSDAGGYFEMARDFHARVAQFGTNPIALAYLNIHPASREPLFIVTTRLVFDLLGESLIHQRYVSVVAAVAGVYVTYRLGRATLGVAAGLGAALLLTLEPWHIMGSMDGLRESYALLWVSGLALAVVALPSAGRWWAVLVGTLAAGATLTRLDAAPVAAGLLVVWALRHWLATRRLGAAWLAGFTYAALVAPLLLGYLLRTGQAFAPLEGQMGGDIQSTMRPLLQGTLPAGEALANFVAGSGEMYGHSLFGELTSVWLGRPSVASWTLAGVLLAAYLGGMVLLVSRRRLVLPALSLLGAYAPPFAFIAGAMVRHQQGGYADRYTYLIAPATFLIAAWGLTQAVRWVVQSLAHRPADRVAHESDMVVMAGSAERQSTGDVLTVPVLPSVPGGTGGADATLRGINSL